MFVFHACKGHADTFAELEDIFTLARDRGAIAAVSEAETLKLPADSSIASLHDNLGIMPSQPRIYQRIRKARRCLRDKYKRTCSVSLVAPIVDRCSFLHRLIEDQFPNTNQTFWYYDGALLNAS